MAEYTQVDSIPDYDALFEEGADLDEKSKKSGMGILKNIFKANIPGVLLSAFLFTIKNSAVWALPIATANIINAAMYPESDSIKRIIINSIVAFVLIVQNIPSHMLYAKYTDKMLRVIGAGLRHSLIKKLQHLSISYHNQIESGKIQSKFLRDIEAIEFFNGHFMRSVVPSIINIIVAIFVIASKSGLVMLFFMFLVPVNVILVRLFSSKMKKNNSVLRRENESMSARVTNMIEMIPVTKAHGLENEEIAALEARIKTLLEKGLILDRTNAFFVSTSWVVAQVLSVICLLFTGILALKGMIKPGDIVIFQSYFATISANIQALLNIYPELTKGLESVRSVSEIMLCDNTEDNNNKIKLRYVHGTIQFKNVCYRYPDSDEDIIKNMDLDISPGECIAVVGGSGSGKSTLMNMVIGFLLPTSGELLIDGKPIEELNLSVYRHFISVVPQNSILFTGSIRENILYGTHDVSEEEFRRVIEMANINDFTDDLPDGLDTQIGEHGVMLSGGQRQRISIARALIRDPKILILDEATSALDNISEYHVQQAISHLIKGRTTFIVAHRLSTVRDADRIIVMDDGRCIEMGTYDELMAKKGKFYELKTLNDMTAAAS